MASYLWGGEAYHSGQSWGLGHHSRQSGGGHITVGIVGVWAITPDSQVRGISQWALLGSGPSLQTVRWGAHQSGHCWGLGHHSRQSGKGHITVGIVGVRAITPESQVRGISQWPLLGSGPSLQTVRWGAYHSGHCWGLGHHSRQSGEACSGL